MRVPERIQVVARILTFVDDTVLLDTGRIAGEHVRVAPVAKRIEIDGHLIVAANVFARGQMASNLSRFLAANERGVEMLAVIGQVSERVLAHRNAVGRLTLAKAADAHAVGKVPIRREVADFGTSRYPRDPHGRGPVRRLGWHDPRCSDGGGRVRMNRWWRWRCRDRCRFR